ncbi:protein FAR1-RELATED SEQUENCE 5-like [Manihot esculenta]|uniref:protein FAR1-RELATED SEQUENCE 5-like n=1 Tax=Manihot esculenta TaxID=3983 RepID=UPI000B5D68C1|nr:protein FAR1-RELATED SEQUENCE 5-like [Manihot esculenta]
MEGSLSHSINNRSSYQSRHNNNSLVRHVLQDGDKAYNIEDSNENEHEELYKVGEVVNDNNNCDEIELAGIDDAPSVGMYYASIDILFNAYLAYAKEKGFSVAKNYASKGNGNVRKYQTISCDRGRKPDGDSSSKRINCTARLSAILRSNGFWQVTKLQTEHNHELDPHMSRFMHAHKSVSSIIKRRLKAHDIAGIRPSKSVRLLEVQTRYPEKLSCLPRDCRNFVDRTRRLKLGNGDVDYINKMFLRMQRENANFFHLIDTDEDHKLTNVFWEHPWSIVAYEELNDVVSVNTTYLVNRYRMPFASIIGVNHHGQSILLGSTLISHKDAKSFKWVFSMWLAAVGGRARISKNIVVNCISEFQWERQFQEAYTTAMFRQAVECEDVNEVDEEFMEEGFEHNKILERSLMNNWYVKEHVYIVLYKEEDINDNLNDVDLNGGNGDLHTEAAIIRNPIVASNRGRPWSNRFRSALELVQILTRVLVGMAEGVAEVILMVKEEL